MKYIATLSLSLCLLSGCGNTQEAKSSAIKLDCALKAVVTRKPTDTEVLNMVLQRDVDSVAFELNLPRDGYFQVFLVAKTYNPEMAEVETKCIFSCDLIKPEPDAALIHLYPDQTTLPRCHQFAINKYRHGSMAVSTCEELNELESWDPARGSRLGRGTIFHSYSINQMARGEQLNRYSFVKRFVVCDYIYGVPNLFRHPGSELERQKYCEILRKNGRRIQVECVVREGRNSFDSRNEVLSVISKEWSKSATAHRESLPEAENLRLQNGTDTQADQDSIKNPQLPSQV